MNGFQTESRFHPVLAKLGEDIPMGEDWVIRVRKMMREGKLIKEMADELGLKQSTLWYRMKKRGMNTNSRRKW